jgi:hypothetical protein
MPSRAGYPVIYIALKLKVLIERINDFSRHRRINSHARFSVAVPSVWRVFGELETHIAWVLFHPWHSLICDGFKRKRSTYFKSFCFHWFLPARFNRAINRTSRLFLR